MAISTLHERKEREMNYRKIAKDILDGVGGKTNVQHVTHCFTRLRFILNDSAKANKEKIERMEGVISVVEAAGQFQIVCGNKVTKIYDALLEIIGDIQTSDEVQQKQSVGNTVLQKLSEIFTPLVPAIAAAGLIKGILAAFGKVPGFDVTNSTYVILNTASNIIFYYMPIFLAYTTAKALKCNKIIAMVLGAFLCHPIIDAMMLDTTTASTIFALPVVKMAFTVGDASKVFSYTESVIPIILAVILLAYLEKLLKKILPEILHLILVPGISLIVMVPVLLVVVGPIGIYVGYVVQWLYTSLYSFSPLLGGIVVGGLWGVFVIFGAHRALLPIGLNDVALTGTNTLMCFAGAANFAQAGASLGVMFKTKSRNLKQVAASASLSAWLVGITEPAIYGCNLRLKKPMICAIIAGACGGAIMGIGHAVNTGFANNGVLTIMSYWGEGTSLGQFIAYLLGIATSFFGAAVLTYFVGFKDDEDEQNQKQLRTVNKASETLIMYAPVEGRVIPMKEIKDEVFSSGALGKSIGIFPTKGEVVAPCDGEVAMVYVKKHALGLKLANGIEMLIHVGINTVELNGRYFKTFVREGQSIHQGDLLIAFDLEQIQKEGYDPTVTIIISQPGTYDSFTMTEKNNVTKQDCLIQAI